MEPEVGSILEGTVTTITKFGAFVSLGGGKSGLVHISEIANTFVNEVRDFLQEGQTVKVYARDDSLPETDLPGQTDTNQQNPAGTSSGNSANGNIILLIAVIVEAVILAAVITVGVLVVLKNQKRIVAKQKQKIEE